MSVWLVLLICVVGGGLFAVLASLVIGRTGRINDQTWEEQKEFEAWVESEYESLRDVEARR
jgi:hypothetical protein